MPTEQNTNLPEPTFKGKHSISMRLWHWSTVLTISGSLLTVLLAKTLLNTKANVALVQDNLQKNNITITSDQAKAVAHDFNDLAWTWHIYFGYVLAALFGFRLLFEFFQPKNQKVIPLLKNGLRYLKQTGINKKTGQHYIFVRFTYVVLYIVLGLQAITGLFMVYSDDVESLKVWRHNAKDVHNVLMWVIISYIVIHLGGVVMAELSKKYKGIVSQMINGGEEN